MVERAFAHTLRAWPATPTGLGAKRPSPGFSAAPLPRGVRRHGSAARTNGLQGGARSTDDRADKRPRARSPAYRIGSDGAREVGRLDQAVPEGADHRLDLLDHALAVELVQGPVDQVRAAVELDVEALGDLVRDGDLAVDLAFAAAQLHPPGLGRDRLPVDRVHVVLAAGEAVVQVILSRTLVPTKSSGEPVGVRGGHVPSIGRPFPILQGVNRTFRQGRYDSIASA